MAISEDGIQVSRTTAEKAFMGVTTTVTVYPDGIMEKDVPEGTERICWNWRRRLKQPMEIDYVEFSDG